MKVPVYQPDLTGNEKKYVDQAIESTWISSKGKFIEKFESEFCGYIKCGNASGVCNGTVAIHLAMEALGIGPGDEVIVPSLTYIASVNPIVQVGALPVFADSLPTSWQVDPESIKAKITDKTKAIVVVHLYGQPADMDEIMKIAKQHNLYVIEDCAEAFGSLYKGKHVGTFGDIGTFSFFGNKTITCGEGGMVVADNKDIFYRLKHLKNQGVSDTKQYWHDTIGFNYRMTNLQAAIGLAQLEKADQFIKRKREVASIYYNQLKDTNLEVHNEQNGTFHTYWMVSVLVDNAADREPLRNYLAANGIETRPLFYPVHTMPMYDKHEKMTVAENLSSRGINLPSWPGLTDDQVIWICDEIKKYYS